MKIDIEGKEIRGETTEDYFSLYYRKVDNEDFLIL